MFVKSTYIELRLTMACVCVCEAALLKDDGKKCVRIYLYEYLCACVCWGVIPLPAP